MHVRGTTAISFSPITVASKPGTITAMKTPACHGMDKIKRAYNAPPICPHGGKLSLLPWRISYDKLRPVMAEYSLRFHMAENFSTPHREEINVIQKFTDLRSHGG